MQLAVMFFFGGGTRVVSQFFHERGIKHGCLFAIDGPSGYAVLFFIPFNECGFVFCRQGRERSRDTKSSGYPVLFLHSTEVVFL